MAANAASFIKKGARLCRGLCRRVVKERLTTLRAEGCGRLSAAGCVRFAQGATAPTALKVTVSPSRAMSFISRLRRSRQHRVSILSAYLVHPFPLRGTSPQGETRVLRAYLSVSYGMISILVIGSLRSPPPIRLRRTSPYAGAEYSPTALFSHSKRRLSPEGVFSIF